MPGARTNATDSWMDLWGKVTGALSPSILESFASDEDLFERVLRLYVLYGETADELFGQDAARGTWHATDKPSSSLLEEFSDFGTMLVPILEQALA